MSIGVIAASYVESQDYDALVMATSPAFYWKMDEASFVNGQTLVDSSGNGRGLLLQGSGHSHGASLLSSGVGGSLIMDGSAGTYGYIPYGTWLTSPTSFTLTFLVNMRSGDSWHIHRWGNGAGNRAWTCIPAGWVSSWVGGAQRDVSFTGMGLGEHHVAYRLSYNGTNTTQTLFFDGVSVGTRTDAGAIQTSAGSDIVMGMEPNGGPKHSLQTSRVAFTPSALSDAQITALAAAA
jgi:hypothetical protein